MAENPYPKPTKRRLRVYAFDPAASVQLDTAVINDAVIELPWEQPWEGEVELGPTNDYFEVIDYDQACNLFYEPVDINDPWLLAQDGLPPAEGNPQFHQQMVFAVAMKTVRNFERALGRTVFWSLPHDDPRVKARKQQCKDSPAGLAAYPPFTKRLRIYPHGMRSANAYFSPGKGALLFGYFKTPPRAEDDEGDWVFTCLSQDIIAHETTHAILHGIRRRGMEPSNRDSLAFHEGFADIVALLQHFTLEKVVAHELRRTGGRLRATSLLTGLASQFGLATGRGGALRLALETLRREQEAVEQHREPVVATLSDAVEPHQRGQFLVAAIFDSFVTIYERRTADLFRIAGAAPGDPHLPDQLVARLAEEAGRTASSVLGMCVRALDYLPPVSATFGDYLRAMITADFDLVPDDPLNYRVALAESFRKRQIPVPGCMSYAPTSLCWETPDLREFAGIIGPDEDLAPERQGPDMLLADALRHMILFARLNAEDGRGSGRRDPAMVSSSVQQEIAKSTYLSGPISRRNWRDETMRVVMRNQAALHRWLADPSPTIQQERMWEALLGLRTLPLGFYADSKSDPPRTSPRSIKHRLKRIADVDPEAARLWTDVAGAAAGEELMIPMFEVHSVRVARRIGPSGMELFQLIAQITQKRRGYFDETEQRMVDEKGVDTCAQPDFWFRGGATLIIDLRDGRLQRIVRQRIDNDVRLAEQRAFMLDDDSALAMAATENGDADETRIVGIEREPFAFVHGGCE